jgi:hypothetical protein
MSAASRSLSALGGLFLLLLVVSLFVVPAVQTLVDPDDIDFPGGRWGVAIMLFGFAAVPGTGAMMLLRRAIRGGAPGSETVEPAPIQSQTEALLTPAAPPPVELAPPIPGASPSDSTPGVASESPLSRAGAPERADAQRKAASIARVRPIVARLLLTSFSRGALTALVSVPMMIAWPQAAPNIGPMALTIFSIVDPLPMAVRPSWWRHAFISGTVWFVLFIIIAAATDIVSDQPDVQIGFILPLMAYPAAMALSSVIRLLQWLSS